MTDRRTLLLAAGFMLTVSAGRRAQARPSRQSLAEMPPGRHEAAMRLAMAEARRNPAYPFGAVIMRRSAANPVLLAKGVNRASDNPMLHGEVACMNDYLRRHGNKGWGDAVLYTTAEPCSMCMSALVWANISGVVYGSSFEVMQPAGIDQIAIRAQTVRDASPFATTELLGGVLHQETDAMFLARKRG